MTAIANYVTETIDMTGLSPLEALLVALDRVAEIVSEWDEPGRIPARYTAEIERSLWLVEQMTATARGYDGPYPASVIEYVTETLLAVDEDEFPLDWLIDIESAADVFYACEG